MNDGRKVFEYTIINRHGMTFTAIDYGCILTSLMTPDREGQFQNVVLGFASLEEYIRDRHYIGCIVGRFANRIGYGRSVIMGEDIQLSTNSGMHHLHGGCEGFNKKLWAATLVEFNDKKGVEFNYRSPDGEEGYPGTLFTKVQYLLDDNNTFYVYGYANADKPTLVNLTHHHYFNLGTEKTILNHHCMIHADHYLETDEALIPTGAKIALNNNTLDFAKGKSIRDAVHCNDASVQVRGGLDHYFILKKENNVLTPAATLYDPVSGRRLEIHTTEPGIQAYTANTNDKIPLKDGKIFQSHCAICLGRQNFPDAPNHPGFPSALLLPGKEYRTRTEYRFSL